MRIWDVAPEYLCRKHLLGEHRELHGLWNIITQNKKGYSNHPETKRWYGKEKALFKRHDDLVAEMKRRGYNHNTPLEADLVVGAEFQLEFIDSLEEQRRLLKGKPCDCYHATDSSQNG